MKHLIANLKAHQELSEAITWINKFVNTVRSSQIMQESLRSNRLRVILAPSFPFLMLYKSACQEFPNVSVSSQDISQFERGSYTGETGSHSLYGIVTHAIIGHSERRRYAGETNQSVREKVARATAASIEPIVCFRSYEDVMTITQGMIAYEPVDAIGTGKNYPVEEVIDFKSKLQLPSGVLFLYGGSVDENNERIYLKSSEVDGLLVGTASLDSSRFCEMLKLV